MAEALDEIDKALQEVNDQGSNDAVANKSDESAKELTHPSAESASSDSSSEASLSSSDASSDSSSESSDGESSHYEADDSDGGANESEVPRTRNELAEIEVPGVPTDLEITKDTQTESIGRIRTAGDRSVIIEAHNSGRYRVLADGAVLVLGKTGEEKIIIGVLYETFGPVDRPLYVVKFNSEEEVEPFKQHIGSEVNQVVATAKYVLTDEFKSKGTDASNFNDEEVPLEEQEFSDDEQEMLAKMAKNKKRKKSRKPKDIQPPAQPQKASSERKQSSGDFYSAPSGANSRTGSPFTPSNAPTGMPMQTPMPMPVPMPMPMPASQMPAQVPGMPMSPEMMAWVQYQQYQQFLQQQQQQQYQQCQQYQQQQQQQRQPPPPPPY